MDDSRAREGEPEVVPGREVDPAVERLLERAFADAAPSLRSVRARVLAELERRPRPDRRHLRPLPFLGRRRSVLFLLNAAAAAVLLTTYFGYLSLIRVQRQALASQTRVEVKNLAIVLRALRERARGGEPKSLDAALARLRIKSDPFGNSYAFDDRALLVYSFGANGRDEHGGGDDIAAFAR